MQLDTFIHYKSIKSRLIKTTILGLSLAFVNTASINAAGNDITTWEDNFDTSAGFKEQDISTENTYDANENYDANYATVENSSVTPLLSENTVKAMQKAADKYSRIAMSGGWPRVTVKLKRGVIDTQVSKLRQRLYLVGDLPRVSGDANVFDFNVDQAVRRFQARHGLVVDGLVSGKTIEALNIPAAQRFEQINLNIKRVKAAQKKLNNRAIVVNIPAMRVETVEENRIVSRHNVVVGQADRQTPTISSNISQVNFNPYWHVPVSIVKRDLVPKILTDPTYIEKTGMRIYKSWGGEEIDPNTLDFTSPDVFRYAYRQDPGRGNSLGIIKLNFANKHAVFMHDTPSKALFTRNFRAYSSGCVRIQNIKQVVDWVLRDQEKWSNANSAEVLSTGERIDISVKSRISVRLVYITNWVTPAGTVHFRRDIYSKDGFGEIASNS